MQVGWSVCLLLHFYSNCKDYLCWGALEIIRWAVGWTAWVLEGGVGCDVRTDVLSCEFSVDLRMSYGSAEKPQLLLFLLLLLLVLFLFVFLLVLLLILLLVVLLLCILNIISSRTPIIIQEVRI